LNFRNSLAAKFLLALFSIVILVIVLSIADRLYGRYFINNTKELIYPPCSKAHHKSSEFDITVKINSLGFRDDEYPLVKKKKYRIAVIGDSFTFGWGVNLEDGWVKILERELNASGLDIEILNLGKGGASPADYTQTAEKTIPLLKPDLVVIAVLQANDLHQLIHAYDSVPVPKIEQPKKSFLTEKTNSLLNRIFPHFMKLIAVRNISIGEQWKREAPALLQSFLPEQKKRFDALDEKVKTDFRSGLLNPWLIHQAVYYPDYFVQPLDTSDIDVAVGISAMADFLEKIKQISAANHAGVITLSVPNLPYSSKEGINDLKKYGFNVPDSIYGNPLADITTGLASAEAEIEYYSVSENFRKNNNDSNLYYKFDGHFTQTGNYKFAVSLKEFFLKKFR